MKKIILIVGALTVMVTSLSSCLIEADSGYHHHHGWHHNGYYRY